MAVNYSAQGSVTIKRLRSGDSLFISFDSNGIPLFQFVSLQGGAVKPDWTVEANRPVLTPKVTSTRGNTVTLSSHTWTYNGVALSFTGENDGSYTKDTTGKFGMNPSTGALKIIGNLASSENTANDTLSYSCVATVEGVEYNLSKSTDIIIQSGGASSYMGLVTANTTQLGEDVTSITVSTTLMLSGSSVPDYYVKWYKNSDTGLWPDKNGQKTIAVTRDDVDGMTLFIAEFYTSSASTVPVSRSAIRIVDNADEFKVVYDITSDNKTVDIGKPVTVTGKVYNLRTNSVVTTTGATWKTQVMSTRDWVAKQTVSSNTVTVTTADTDDDNGQNDVEVVGEVSWNG